jgi:hypothetical protein
MSTSIPAVKASLFVESLSHENDEVVPRAEAKSQRVELQDNYEEPHAKGVDPATSRWNLVMLDWLEREDALKGNYLASQFKVGMLEVADPASGPSDEELSEAAFDLSLSLVSDFESYDAGALAKGLEAAAVDADAIDASLDTIQAVAGEGGTIRMASWTAGYMTDEEGKLLVIHPKGARGAIVLNVSTMPRPPF